MQSNIKAEGNEIVQVLGSLQFIVKCFSSIEFLQSDLLSSLDNAS